MLLDKNGFPCSQDPKFIMFVDAHINFSAIGESVKVKYISKTQITPRFEVATLSGFKDGKTVITWNECDYTSLMPLGSVLYTKNTLKCNVRAKRRLARFYGGQ
jgi:hypothetical protein